MVHAQRLEELAANARAHEERKELVAAHDDWQAALELLPTDSSQAAWVRAKRDELFQAIRQEAAKDRLASHQDARFPNAPRPMPPVPDGKTGTNRPGKS